MRALLLAMLISSVAVEASAAEMVGQVVSTRGLVEVQLVTRGPWSGTFRGDHLPEGARVRTASGSTARLLMKDRSVLMLGPRSELKVATYRVHARKRRTSLKLKVGWLWARVRRAMSAEDRYELGTTNAVAGVRGTDLIVSSDGVGNSMFACLHGVVEVADTAGIRSVTIETMQRVAVGHGGLGGKTPVDSGEVRGLLTAFGAAQLSLDRAPSAASGDEPPQESQREQFRARWPDSAWGTPGAAPIDLEPRRGMGTLRGRVEVRDP